MKLTSMIALVVLPFGCILAQDQAANTSSCVTCHAALDGTLAQPAQLIKDDVHTKNGLSCASCHGGDPTSMDMTVAMSSSKGFLGEIERRAIPELCGRCHSDATFIHKFRPQQRVDQLALYRTSVHGKRLAQGDTAVAVCTDCHSVHDIREVKDVLSPVYPLKLAETCSRCHSDAAHMSEYNIPTDQFAKYQKSVHFDALTRKLDLSAPNCASCHGSHGATPPGVENVARACGSCHVVFQDLFDQSPHRAAFEALGFPGCATCHENHEVRKPTPEMLGVNAEAACVKCHIQGDGGYAAAQAMRQRMDQLQSSLGSAGEIVRSAERYGMEMSDARLQLAAANEQLVKARVQVHRFRLDAVDEPIAAGLTAARNGYDSGAAALHERDVRRRGMLLSVAAIVVTIVALWLTLRRIERSGSRPQ
jgi:predicted CXXCH cytochrome family protein